MADSNDKPKTGPGSEKCEVSMEALKKAQQDLKTAPARAAQGRHEMDAARQASNHTNQNNHDAVVANNQRSLDAKTKAYAGEVDMKVLPKKIPGLEQKAAAACAAPAHSEPSEPATQPRSKPVTGINVLRT